MNEHAIGFVTGLVLAILVIGMVKRILYKRNGKMPEYDEMQKIAQGMAYKYGFLTAVSAVVVCSVLDILNIHFFEDDATPMFLVLFLSVGVFAGCSIWKEAYFGLHANTCRYVRFLVVVTAINLIAGIQNLRSGEMFSNGRLNYRCVNMGCAILLMVMLLIMLIKKKMCETEE